MLCSMDFDLQQTTTMSVLRLSIDGMIESFRIDKQEEWSE